MKAMLDSLSPSDPILLLAVVDGPFSALPRDVRSWFGFTRETRVSFTYPDAERRRKFFDELLEDIRREPSQFPDGVKRRKRILEELPIAPPLEPRQPTPAELALQEENDQKILTLLKYRLGPILQELKRKFKRFTKPARVSKRILLFIITEVNYILTSRMSTTSTLPTTGILSFTAKSFRTILMVMLRRQMASSI